MATEVKLPDVGEGITDVTINRWLVAEGDTVNEGDVILEVATDKVDTGVTAPVRPTCSVICNTRVIDCSAGNL